MTTHGFTRRYLIKGSGAVLASAVLLRPGSMTAAQEISSQEISSSRSHLVGGVVEQLILPKTAIIKSVQEGSVVVRFADNASFSRGRVGRVSGLKAFIAGDEVVAEGQWSTKDFVATNLLSVYRLIEGRIVQREGDRLEMTDITIQLMPDTKSLQGPGFVTKPIDQISDGDVLVAEVWRDPANRQVLALRLGVREAQG